MEPVASGASGQLNQWPVDRVTDRQTEPVASGECRERERERERESALGQNMMGRESAERGPTLHYITILCTCSPAHLLTCSPAHLSTCSPAHLLTCSPAHLLTWCQVPSAECRVLSAWC